MSDVITVRTLFSSPKRIVRHLTCVSDGTGETGAIKLDISTFTFGIPSFVPVYSTIDMIDYYIQGFTSVELYWDHSTDDIIAALPAGAGTLDFGAIGGNTDPKSSGGTGDIILTSVGAVNGATYDIVLYIRPKV